MELKVVGENELRRAMGEWMLDNSRAEFIPAGASREDYLAAFRLPEVSYAHTQTCLDSDGDAISILKASVLLKDWQTKNGVEDARFVFYKVLKTFTATPDVEPCELGYIIV